MDPSLETTHTPISTPSLKKLFSPTPIKANVDSDLAFEQERNQQNSSPPLQILPLAEALEYAQKNGLPKQKRILLPSSKRKSLLRPTKIPRENTHVTAEEAIQATMERIGPRHHRILNLIATRDPMDTITAEEFWQPETQVFQNKMDEESIDTGSNHSTSTPIINSKDSETVQDESEQGESDYYPWRQVDGDVSTTTPCTVQVDFDIPHTNENDDLSFSYAMPPTNDEDDLYLQQSFIDDQHKHSYKVQHVAGMTVGSDSTDSGSHPCKRPKTSSKSIQSLGTRKTENRRGQPRELRFLSTSREDDGLREVGSGLRRSQRTRFPVLKFWKNETILYERRDSRPFPTIAGILAYPDTPREEPERKKRRRRRGSRYSRTTLSGAGEYASGIDTSESSSEEPSHRSNMMSHHSNQNSIRSQVQG